MIEYDLSRFIPKLEEISVAASREFTLEQNLKKMKFEWQNVAFELIIFRCVHSSYCIQLFFI